MASAKIFSLADYLSVDENHLKVPQNVRLVLVDNSGQAPDDITSGQMARNTSGSIGNYKTPNASGPLENLTAYIIIVDTKIGNEEPDFPITFGGIKPRSGQAMQAGITGYTAYKFDLSNIENIQPGGKIPLDIDAFGNQQQLDISDPDNPDVKPIF